MAILVSQDELLRDVALNNFMTEVVTHRVTTDRVDLEALLQTQSARRKTDVHKSSAREVGVGNYSEHWASLLPGFSVATSLKQRHFRM